MFSHFGFKYYNTCFSRHCYGEEASQRCGETFVCCSQDLNTAACLQNSLTTEPESEIKLFVFVVL